MRRAIFIVALSALAMLGGTGTITAAASGAEGPFPAPEAVNAPPAAATLIFLGTSARVDRAADSASRIRVTVEGSPPVAASISASTQQHLGRPPPQAVGASRALAAATWAGSSRSPNERTREQRSAASCAAREAPARRERRRRASAARARARGPAQAGTRRREGGGGEVEEEEVEEEGEEEGDGDRDGDDGGGGGWAAAATAVVNAAIVEIFF